MIKLKEFIRLITPPIFVHAYHGYKAGRISYSTANLNAYRQLNADSRTSEITLRPAIRLNILPECKIPFEYFCYRDDECVQEMDCFLALARDKSRFLDVGALYGVFSLAFTTQQKDGRALAVEPSTAAFPSLLYNIHKNPDCHVRALDMALSDRDGTIDMRLDWKHLVAAGASGASKDDCISIASRTGDSLCSAEEFRPDLIKIDVEGYEYECLRGLTQTIDDNRPTIFLELHPELLKSHGHLTADIAEYFRQKSYQCLDLQRRPIPLSFIEKATQICRLFLRPMETAH